MEHKAWYDIGASIATMVGAIGIIFLFIQHIYNRDVRNLQLMHRCIDNFRTWSDGNLGHVNFFYLEFLNEELFYFQKKLIEKQVSIEWIEGILDFVLVYSLTGEPLNLYNAQEDLNRVPDFATRRKFFNRVDYFINTGLSGSYAVPPFEDANHSLKKRQLALQLYKHIKRYKY